jgi:hypothetical protein
MKKWIGLGLLVTSLAIVFAAPAAPSVVELKSPAAPGSEAPNVSVAPDGRTFLSWLEPGAGKAYSLKFSLRQGQGWSTPQTIASGANWFVSGVDYPTIAFMADGTMAASWFVATNLDREAYNTSVSLSRDSGKTWSKPLVPHKDRKERQHGFVSFMPAPDGKLGAIWLDGKKLDKDGFGDMGLFYTTIGKDGSIGTETTLDSRVCECCQTSATATPDGMLAVYRDRSAKEVRDIFIARFTNGKWSPGVPLSNDGWEIDGCPVNGPAISSNGRNVAVAWFTAPNEKAQVNLVLSTDAGRTFGKPVRIDGGNTSGRLDVVSLASGAAVVSWVERATQGSQVHLRQVEANGVAGPVLNVSGAGGLQPGSVPRIERAGNDFIVAWTASGDRPIIHTAVVNMQ